MTAVPRPREWDAATYDSLPLPHQRWGRGVLATLALRGDERVLDVGAGTGRDTAALLEQRPPGSWRWTARRPCSPSFGGGAGEVPFT